MKTKTKVYLTAIVIPLLVGGLSALITKDAMKAFESVTKPPLSPPMWLFPVVWSILFILMGIGSARVYLADKNNSGALTVYAIQLVFNFFWSIIFFNFRLYLFAFVWLMILWVLIIYMIYKFLGIDKPAAYMQIPYLLWVTFAAYLNFAIYWLNS